MRKGWKKKGWKRYEVRDVKAVQVAPEKPISPYRVFVDFILNFWRWVGKVVDALTPLFKGFIETQARFAELRKENFYEKSLYSASASG